MHGFVYALARRLWPELEEMPAGRRAAGLADFAAILYNLPIAIVTLVWLARISDWSRLRSEWILFLLFFGLIAAFSRLGYFMIMEIQPGNYASADGSLEGVIYWTAALLLGPVGLWVVAVWSTGNFLWNWRSTASLAARWNLVRNYVATLNGFVFAILVALVCYERWGGSIPIRDLSPASILPAFGAILVQFAIFAVIFMAYIAYAIWGEKLLGEEHATQPILRFLVMGLGSLHLGNPFAILGAGLYVENGLFTLVFFLAGLLLVALLSRQLSWAAESSRQQSRQLEKLEHLGREIINAPLDASTLATLLEEHVPSMFSNRRILIWLYPDRTLVNLFPDGEPDIVPVWEWMQSKTEARIFNREERLAWDETEERQGTIIVAPILDVESSQPIGLIYLELRAMQSPWDRNTAKRWLAPIQSLGAQVASAMYQARVYQQNLEMHKTLQEISLAQRIQSSFLPQSLPEVPGWQIAAALEPAREIAGDFYDFIKLPNGSLGILIADVADKGLGPSLYMALSRTLIRTFADHYPLQPELVFRAANLRILEDAHANLFVTVFYGILDPTTGKLTYCNAGHSPPYLFPGKNLSSPQTLGSTGMPLGIDPEAVWQPGSVVVESGDVLLLYTDGVTDAQNEEGKFIDRAELLRAVQGRTRQSASEIQAAVLEAVHEFTGQSAQFDDITLVILARQG